MLPLLCVLLIIHATLGLIAIVRYGVNEGPVSPCPFGRLALFTCDLFPVSTRYQPMLGWLVSCPAIMVSWPPFLADVGSLDHKPASGSRVLAVCCHVDFHRVALLGSVVLSASVIRSSFSPFPQYVILCA